MKRNKYSRREMLGRSAKIATALTLAISSPSQAVMVNERIRLGFIGVGNRGSQLLHSFMKSDDVEVAALCDVYKPFLARQRSGVDPRLLESLGSRIPAMGEQLERASRVIPISVSC